MIDGRRHIKAEALLWALPFAAAVGLATGSTVAAVGGYATIMLGGFLVERFRRDVSGAGDTRRSE